MKANNDGITYPLKLKARMKKKKGQFINRWRKPLKTRNKARNKIEIYKRSRDENKARNEYE